MVKEMLQQFREEFDRVRMGRSVNQLYLQIGVNRVTLNTFVGGGRVSTATLERIEAWIMQEKERLHDEFSRN